MDQIEAAGVELFEPFVCVCSTSDTSFATIGATSSFDNLRCSPLHTSNSYEVDELPSLDGTNRTPEEWRGAYGHELKTRFSDSICYWQTPSLLFGSTVMRSANRGSLDMSIYVDEEAGKRKKNEDSFCRDLCVPSPSCVALKNAVLRLYRMEDFSLEPLGEGFFSEVYRVRHRVTGDILVLKLNKVSSNRSNVLREVELMRKLRHPNVLRFRGACVDNGQLHALTEYCQAGGLDKLIASDEWIQLAWSIRVSLALDVSRGMEYIHSCGYMHRDLTSRVSIVDNFLGRL
ncbi:Pkinase Tyr domain containing protein [Trichuris trichiura]|uniref:Pkinase Tyr domain containing protein n=1 Tax=Trichuris trichiura TaxID=36087 RepID=A0A077ZIX1_TRITR|nr:Pkinase Tyr domain containing protein [Trichuris trichiura]